jgi:anti-sigma regulatory factor (Ser/Thr protein kinase)
VLSVWRDAGELVCEISDGGARIADPLAGRRRPDPRSPHGRGLWMINQVCDLVELRSGPGGTTVRLHMTLS